MTYAEHAPRELGKLFIGQQQLQRMPNEILKLAQALFALILLAVWVTERQRTELLWFALYLTVEAVISTTSVLLTSPDSLPWSWHLRNTALVPLRAALFVEFAMVSLDQYRWP